MFSTVSEAVRGSVLGPLLELPSAIVDTTAPVSQAPGDTQHALDFTLELDEIEERFNQISYTAFNFEKLQFRDAATTLSEPEAVLDALLPTARPTHDLIFRVNSLKRLALELRSLQEEYGLSTSEGAQPADISRCDSLLATVNLTLDGLLAMAQECYNNKDKLRKANEEEGINLYRFVTPYSTGRFLPPVVIATTLLIAIIHSLMSVTRDNCNAILAILRSILQLAFNGQDLRTRSFVAANVNTIPITLGTALIYLGLPTQLDVYVTCPKCSYLYPLAKPESIPELCNASYLLGYTCNEPLFNVRRRGTSSWKQPIRQSSYQRLEVWLSKFLSRPEIEDLLEKAYPEPEKDGVTDFWGAPFLANFQPEGESSNFFDAPEEELRLVFMVYHDFFNPYYNMIAGKKYSTGMVIMICLNLPPDIRYDRENVYLAAVLPGPSLSTEERAKAQQNTPPPAEDRMNHFMRPIAENLEEHFKPGVWIAQTAKYPKGRKVRSAAPITSMDIPASRDWGGLGSHAHNMLCSFCLIVQAYIDVFQPDAFPRRSMEQHRLHVEEWKRATNPKERAEIWSKYGARYSEWLRFPWWDITTGIPFAPMHWTKNILEKQLRVNMGWSLTNPAGIPVPTKLNPITVVEKEWGRLAMLYYSVKEFELPELLLRHLCRQHALYETGLPSSRMTEDLNKLRGIIDKDGKVVEPAPRLCVPERGSAKSLANIVTLAKAESFLGKAKKPSLLLNNSSLNDLFLLCAKFNLPYHIFNTKAQLAAILMEHYKNVRVAVDGEDDPAPSKPVAWLGYEVLSEVKDDMDETTIPSWMKTPPKNFASVSHGKIGAEEYKSLALVSFTFTLIRLWGQASVGALRERLDHFLHLTIPIRILGYHARTEADVQTFEHHISIYLNDVKRLYPTCSIIPTQHYALHIPHFLRQLGPAVRFNENPAEMFVGMLQDVHTNFKRGDSHILFRTRGARTPLPGRIESILVEKSYGGTPRITILAREFPPLSPADRFYDPYSQHPIAGSNGYGYAELRYRELNPKSFILQPSDLICHLALYNFRDAEEKLSAPCVAAMSFDTVCDMPYMLVRANLDT
ncbi:hypothetical protein FRC09_010104 [Ceratobasidium sp. 395]|nr:hypothetical protein FRC09_010104 [Ceratobasidium sp. 395]